METKSKTILKTKTINIIKELRTVPDHITEGRKKFSKIRKAMLASLKEEPKTIPQLAVALSLTLPETTYYLMSLQKFGDVTAEGIDDMDEYYIYKLIK